jgi:hypothetical protein
MSAWAQDFLALNEIAIEQGTQNDDIVDHLDDERKDHLA